MDFDAEEDRDGIRWSWNVWPSSRLEATRLVVPVGCMYTPLKENMPLVYYEPVACKGSCRSVLNPFCAIDVKAKLWICPFCLQRNQFPPSYADISETNLPAELIPNYTTIEYVISRNQPLLPPVFLFAIDTCLIASELEELKANIIKTLSLLPENSVVGLITFGKTVQVYELAFEECPKSYVFSGTKDVTSKQLQDQLKLGAARNPQNPNTPGNRFLMPLQDVEFTLESIVEELQPDPNPVKSDKRPLRATGVAMSVGIGLLENSFPNSGARLMVFTGGAVTHGPGQIASDDLREPLRGHSDLTKEKAKHTKKAQKFYGELAARAVKSGHTVDILCCSLDQCGYYEMQEVSKRTGGLVVMADSFDDPAFGMFKQTLAKLFQKDDKGALPMAFNATIEVQTTRELKVCGAIGHCASLGKKSSSVAEMEIGMGNTCAWKLPCVDPQLTLALYFEIVNQVRLLFKVVATVGQARWRLLGHRR
eukprot:TRINITY_DN7629_c0_g2_i1.p1 TRINITY_DN7629_c0_g2~~TRINITY_DN7629_c0_g2_i1.p1  ORF type:complete len:479 (-),score=121.89 TRINITY_DN7629_c0_g2_i1:987-2423(-)